MVNLQGPESSRRRDAARRTQADADSDRFVPVDHSVLAEKNDFTGRRSRHHSETGHDLQRDGVPEIRRKTHRV